MWCWCLCIERRNCDLWHLDVETWFDRRVLSCCNLIMSLKKSSWKGIPAKGEKLTNNRAFGIVSGPFLCFPIRVCFEEYYFCTNARTEVLPDVQCSAHPPNCATLSCTGSMSYKEFDIRLALPLQHRLNFWRNLAIKNVIRACRPL